MVEVNYAIEHADRGTVLGNEFTVDTYRYAGKPLHRIPISAPEIYDWPAHREMTEARRHFIWFGSSGFVHKGLDRVLEAFAQLPDLHLHVCGPFDDEPDFLKVYDRELFHTPNIHAEGWVDVASQRFRDLCAASIAVVYPSASEGGGGSVISCMHAGLVPIVSREASVDIGEFGFDLADGGVPAVMAVVRRVAQMPPGELEARARAAWEHVRARHTREEFSRAFGEFLDSVVFA
jgi:glycosyltransferase involved in cell wall biosynthesis